MKTPRPAHGQHCFCRDCTGAYADYMAMRRKMDDLERRAREAELAVPCTDREWREHIEKEAM